MNNSSNTNTTSGGALMLRPGVVLQGLGGRRRSSDKTEYLAARKLRTIGVPLLKIGNAWFVPRAAFEAWLASPACLAAAAEAQQSKSRRAGRPSAAEAALRAAVAKAMDTEVRHG
ncbi:hypothetical protein [Metallibacterium sp.]|uniref:hypothetical protein n=1 Tax=Metallibacterium sp. TaxID=2940281 RepID=UPI002615D55A|nr:hypothetical protein [Metallibacterium sp.]